MAHDYGPVILPSSFKASDGSVPRHHQITVLTDTELANLSIHLSGYPADKEFGSQWTDDDPITAIQGGRLQYMIDTYGGHSGSAIIPVGRTEAVGIHNYGGCPNRCTRITSHVKADVEQRIAESKQ